MEGGTKHVTLRRFEPYRPSCTNLTPTRATASGSALLAFFMATKAITYLHAEGDVEECFAARGAHNLFLEGEAQRRAILGSITGVSLVDGIKEVEWPALAELIMPFVTLAADARGAGYGAVYIDDDAWSRWAEAMASLLAGMDTSAWSKSYGEIMRRLETASDDVKARLHLHLADLVPVQPDVHHAEEGSAAQKKNMFLPSSPPPRLETEPHQYQTRGTAPRPHLP